MTVVVSVDNVMGDFCRVDGRDDFNIGEYYRLPNGDVYFYHSFDPKIEFMLVMENDIPKGTLIFDLKRFE